VAVVGVRDRSFSGGANTMSALLSGQLQLAQVGGSEVLSAAARGADVVIVATLSPVFPYVFMAAADIRSPADLEGKKVGISTAGGSADIAIRQGLRQVGIGPDKDVTIVPVGSHVDSIVQAAVRIKRNRALAIRVLRQYFKSEGERAMGKAADFFAKEVLPSPPYPEPEQFAAAKSVLGQRNEKVRTFDVASILDTRRRVRGLRPAYSKEV